MKPNELWNYILSKLGRSVGAKATEEDEHDTYSGDIGLDFGSADSVAVGPNLIDRLQQGMEKHFEGEEYANESGAGSGTEDEPLEARVLTATNQSYGDMPEWFHVLEPTMAVYSIRQQKYVAVGTKAKNRYGHSKEGDLVPIRPIERGVIKEPGAVRALVPHLLKRFRPISKEGRPQRFDRVLVGLPQNAQVIDYETMFTALFDDVQTSQAYIAPQPLLAAVGAGLPIHKPEASVIVDIGGGTTDIATFYEWEMVSASSILKAGNDVDEELRTLFKEIEVLDPPANEGEEPVVNTQKTAVLGPSRAEKLKIRLCNFQGTEEQFDQHLFEVEVSIFFEGHSKPGIIKVPGAMFRKVFDKINGIIVNEVVKSISSLPIELNADVREIVLAGGGAKLRGLNIAIEKAMSSEGKKVIVRIADEPHMCVARGISVCLGCKYSQQIIDYVATYSATEESYRQAKGKGKGKNESGWLATAISGQTHPVEEAA